MSRRRRPSAAPVVRHCGRSHLPPGVKTQCAEIRPLPPFDEFDGHRIGPLHECDTRGPVDRDGLLQEPHTASAQPAAVTVEVFGEAQTEMIATHRDAGRYALWFAWTPAADDDQAVAEADIGLRRAEHGGLAQPDTFQHVGSVTLAPRLGKSVRLVFGMLPLPLVTRAMPVTTGFRAPAPSAK